jgi:hypothetical protein
LGLKPTPENKSLVTARPLGTRLLTLVVGLAQLHQLDGRAALFQLARQPQHLHLQLRVRLAAFHIFLTVLLGRLAQRLRQTLWLLVVELA